MLDASGTTTYTYDHADRLNVVTNGYGQSVSYSYSGINQRLTLQDPSLATFSYTYDAARRLSTVVNPQNSRTTFSYDLADRRMLAHNGNGTSTSYVYDAADRLLWLNHFGPGSAGIAGFTYTYDNVGNPQTVLELDGSTVDWTNDGANQLILEDRTGTDAAHRKNYYDGRGNRFEQDLNSGLTKVNGFTYDNADQLKVLTSYNLPAIATLTSYTYDPAGNLLGVLNPPGTQPTTFAWDDEGRSKLVQLPTGVSVTSTFNGDNLRMQRVDNTGTVRYVWDGQAYLAETDGSNVMQAEYTQEPAQYGGLLSQYRLTGGVWTPSYYHFDRIGSTRALTSSSGSITDTYFYEAFGTSLGGSGSTVNPFQFIGQVGYYRDAASGLYYVRDRVYDPVTGRWVSRDRIGFASGDPNPFRYALNNPTFYDDPAGLWTQATALQRLQEEIQDWQSKGYGFAVHLLQHFIDKLGPAPYQPTQGDIDEVISHSAPLVRYSLTAWKVGPNHPMVSRHVSWDAITPVIVPTFATDANLFYAYGGADLTLIFGTGRWSGGAPRRGRYIYENLTVTLADFYTFAPTGTFNSRLLFPAYDAAHFLQTVCGFNPFTDTMTFKRDY